MLLGSHVAVAAVQAGSCSSSSLTQELPYATGAAVKREKRKKKKEREKEREG